MLRGLVSLASTTFLVAVPALTVWLASSLVAFHGGPPEASVAAGVLLFPALPLWWEWRASRAFRESLAQRKQFGVAPKRKLTALARVSLRTLAIGLVFLVAMVAAFPKTTFAALSTRGDWFLPDGDRGEPWRALAFQLAQGLEGLHRLANPNPWATAEDRTALAQLDPKPTPTEPLTVTTPSGSGARWRRLTDEERAAREGLAPKPTPPTGTAGRQQDDDGSTPIAKLTEADDGSAPIAKLSDDEEDDDWKTTGKASGRAPSIAKLREGDAPDPSPPPAPATFDFGRTHWPWKAEVSPVVRAMRPEHETSIAAVAAHIASQEPDGFRRVKALHDWVVTRLEYDVDSTKPGRRKPQDAETVFRTRRGVCEGYARLLVALGALTKDPIVFVPGDVREESGAMAPVGHAWNAAFVEGAWYLIDATWDDPLDQNERSTSYSTDHLFIPPSVAVWSHLPDDPRWQLLAHPLSRGDFLRQPFSRPGIAVHGLTVRSPSRVTVEASEVLPVQLDNPLRRWLIVSFKDASGRKRECANTSAERVDLRCPVPSTGELAVFANEQQYGRYGQVLSVAVTRR
jgi:transglutaminase-like putative cysteine protease